MRQTLFLLLLWPAGLSAQTLEHRWMNQPCAQVLNCDSGCTACNLPEGGGAVLIGTNMGVVGVDVCPHPVTVADNAVFTYGWPSFPDASHALLLSGLTLQPLQLDSIVIRHRHGPDGTERLRIGLSINNAPAVQIADVNVSDVFGTTVLTDLGVVAATEAMAAGMYQLVLQPYQGQGGSWDLDEVRIVASPASTTGIGELEAARTAQAPRYDVLGRPAARTDMDGVFIDRFKRIRVQ